MNTFLNLHEIQEEIQKLDPLIDDVKYFEQLLQNAFEIMISHKLETSELSHLYNNKEFNYAINGTINQNRIDNFKSAQNLCKGLIPQEYYSIDEIPESWSMPPVERYY